MFATQLLVWNAYGTDSITYYVTVNDTPLVNAGSDKYMPVGGGVVLIATAQGNGPFIYHWSPSSGLDEDWIYNPLVSGISDTTTYTVTVYDDNYCSASDRVIVYVGCDTSSHPAITAGTCYLSTAYIPSASYQWQLNRADIAGAIIHYYTAEDTGYYRLKLTKEGCSSYSHEVYKECFISAISEIGLNNFSIFPNPNSGAFLLYFETNKPEQVQVKIFDLTGQLVEEETEVRVRGVYSKEIKLGHVAKGIYILNVRIGDEIMNKRIEIE